MKGKVTENPSTDTIKRSFSQINLNNSRRTYHKRFLSKPSLSISQINNSAYYNRQNNMTKGKFEFQYALLYAFYSEVAKYEQRSDKQIQRK